MTPPCPCGLTSDRINISLSFLCWVLAERGKMSPGPAPALTVSSLRGLAFGWVPTSNIWLLCFPRGLSPPLFLFLPSVLLSSLLSHGGKPLVYFCSEGGVGKLLQFTDSPPPPPQHISCHIGSVSSVFYGKHCTNQVVFFFNALFVLHEVFHVYSRWNYPKYNTWCIFTYVFSYEHPLKFKDLV